MSELNSGQDWLAVVRSEGEAGGVVRAHGQLPATASHYGGVCAIGDSPRVALARLAQMLRRLAGEIDASLSERVDYLGPDR